MTKPIQRPRLKCGPKRKLTEQQAREAKAHLDAGKHIDVLTRRYKADRNTIRNAIKFYALHNVDTRIPYQRFKQAIVQQQAQP